MKPKSALMLLVFLLAASAGERAAAQDSWDGLAKVDSRRFHAVYLLPGADFRAYNKVMIDNAEVAFRKNWIRDFNRSTNELSRRISESDAKDMAERVRTGFNDIIRRAFADAGYSVVTVAAPDVMRLSPAVINLEVAAPDTSPASAVRSSSLDSGEATVVLEVRDSTTGALLGRAVDRDEAGNNIGGRRTQASNRADFTILFRAWAKASVDGLALLKQLSPINPATAR